MNCIKRAVLATALVSAVGSSLWLRGQSTTPPELGIERVGPTGLRILRTNPPTELGLEQRLTLDPETAWEPGDQAVVPMGDLQTVTVEAD